MSEFPELFEKIDRLDREMDVQAALIESLTDKVSYLGEAVLQLELTKATRRSTSKKDVAAPPATPSKPGGHNAACTAGSE